MKKRKIKEQEQRKEGERGVCHKSMAVLKVNGHLLCH